MNNIIPSPDYQLRSRWPIELMGKDDIFVGKVLKVTSGRLVLRCDRAVSYWFTLPAELLWDAEDLLGQNAYVVGFTAKDGKTHVAEIRSWNDDPPPQFVLDPLIPILEKQYDTR